MKPKNVFQYTLAVLAFTAGCMVSQKAQTPMSTEFDRQGHRGCRGLMPENTLPAMVEALGMNVSTLEMDVVITGDSQVLVSHEPWFSSEITTLPGGGYISPADEKNYNIYDMDYDRIKTFDVGLKPHSRFKEQKKIPAYKPLLSAVFDTIRVEMMTRRRPPVKYNIEIKSTPAGDGIFHPAPPEFVERVMAVISSQGLEDYVNIQSFDTRPLQYLHEKYPAMPLAMLIEGKDLRSLEKQLKDLGFVPQYYSPHFSRVDARLVREVHERGMKIIPWTVNDRETIRKLKEMGVDGIITDYPNLFD